MILSNLIEEAFLIEEARKERKSKAQEMKEGRKSKAQEMKEGRQSKFQKNKKRSNEPQDMQQRQTERKQRNEIQRNAKKRHDARPFYQPYLTGAKRFIRTHPGVKYGAAGLGAAGLGYAGYQGYQNWDQLQSQLPPQVQNLIGQPQEPDILDQIGDQAEGLFQ